MALVKKNAVLSYLCYFFPSSQKFLGFTNPALQLEFMRSNTVFTGKFSDKMVFAYKNFFCHICYAEFQFRTSDYFSADYIQRFWKFIIYWNTCCYH